MISRVSLSTFAVLAFAGVGGGIYLGKAAVSDINPLYYSEPPTRFHGDLVPHPPTDAAVYRAGDLSAVNVEQALGIGCIGCRAYPEEVVLVHRGTTGKADIGYAEVSSEPVAAVPAVFYAETPAVEFASVERYSSYPITQQAEPTIADLAQDEPVAAKQNLGESSE